MDRNDHSSAEPSAPECPGVSYASIAREWMPFGFVALIAILTLAPTWAPSAGSRGKQEQRASTTSAIPKSNSVPSSSSGRVRAQVFLSDNSIALALTDKHGPLAGHMSGAGAAKREALTSPTRLTESERRIARSMDAQRTAAMTVLRHAAASGTRQSERVARKIRRLGGSVIDAPVLPNSIVALVPVGSLSRLKSDPAVASIAEAPAPVWASSWTDGSETWHAAGFTGGGSSADGNGGPDYLAFDQGLTTAHLAFRARLGGDSPTGPGSGPTRVISPAGRTNFSGSGHGNNVAGIVASTDLTPEATGAGPPAPPTWPYRKGLAHGLDKLYDPMQAKSPGRWGMGFAYMGEPGVSDLPELLNYSAGIYEDTTDFNPTWSSVDTEVAEFGITHTISAGNCGINPSIYTGCNGAPGGNSTRRVSTPGNLFNTITVGGLTTPDIYDSTTWTVWPNSSSGPTYGGRKKPDLIAKPNSGPCPANWDVDSDTQLNDYDNCGTGTSYAAPQAAAGAILLASTGIYKSATQKALLINTATPIQGQTYWMPRSGWGALNLDGAFTHRGHYEDGFVTETGANSARFFSQSSVAVGDRTTLVWNRRTTPLGSGATTPLYMTVTDLDLFQFAAGDTCSPSCTPTATGGVDANDSVDTDQTVTADNPMPGNGTDGPDNVEQVRSTATGDQVIKVKAMSTIDGATEEPFSLAANHTLTALETPIPDVTLTATPATVGPGETVTVNATIDNPSADLALTNGQVSLNLPPGVSLTGGDANPKSLSTIAANGSAGASWQVSSATGADHVLSATATGTTYGETFSGQATDDFTVDANPPLTSASGPGAWSTASSPAFDWSATDASGIASYDVELSRDGGAFTPLLTGTTSISTSVPGSEGEKLTVRVRATDEHANTSGWTEAETTVDAIPPEVAIGAESFPAKNSVSAPVSASNVGAPVSAQFAFSGGGTATPFAGSSVATYTNTTLATTATTLTVTATDALGRTATAVRSFTVPSLMIRPGLKITAISSRGGRLTVRGAISREFVGRVTVVVSRTGSRGSKRIAKRVRVRSGRFSLRTSVEPGKYRVRVTSPQTDRVVAGSVRKVVRAR